MSASDFRCPGVALPGEISRTDRSSRSVWRPDATSPHVSCHAPGESLHHSGNPLLTALDAALSEAFGFIKKDSTVGTTKIRSAVAVNSTSTRPGYGSKYARTTIPDPVN